MTVYRAGEVVTDFTANLKPLKRGATLAEQDLRKSGKKAGTGFAVNVDRAAEPRLKRAGQRGIRGFLSRFKAKAAGRSAGVDFSEGFLASKPGSLIAKSLKGGLLAGTILTGAAAGFSVVAGRAIDRAANLKVLADVAGLTAERFQELTYAADRFEISQEKLSDQLKDVDDRVGDLILNNSGPLKDFLDSVGRSAGLTIDTFRGLSSAEVLSLVVRTMENAGASGAELTNVMESLASDSTALIPLFKDNGKLLNELSAEARAAGGVLSNEMAQGAFDANVKLEELKTQIGTGLTRALVELSPEIEALTADLIELVPVLLGWVDGAIGGLLRVADAIEDAGDAWNASPFGKGQIGFNLNPEGVKQTQAAIDRLDDLQTAIVAFESSPKTRNFPLGSKAGGEIDLKTLSNQNNSRQVIDVIGTDVFGKDALKDLRKDSNAFFAEVDKIRVELEAKLKAFENATPARTIANPGPSRVRTSGITSSADRAALEKAARELEQKLNERKSIIERYQQEVRGPLEVYADELKTISDLETNAIGGLVLDSDTATRARLQALIQLAETTQDAAIVTDALNEAMTRGEINAGQAAIILRDLSKGHRDVVQSIEGEIAANQELAIAAGQSEQEYRIVAETIRIMGSEFAGTRAEARLLAQEIVLSEDAISDALDDAADSADRFGESAVDAFARSTNAFSNFIRSIENGDVAGIIEGLGGLFQALAEPFIGTGGGGSVPSFNGGGFTGKGARSGGVDGKGGFLAVLHPNETVFDHKGFTPPSNTAAGAGPMLTAQKSEVMIVPSRHFDAVVQGAAVQVVNGVSPAHANSAVQQAQAQLIAEQARRL